MSKISRKNLCTKIHAILQQFTFSKWGNNIINLQIVKLIPQHKNREYFIVLLVFPEKLHALFFSHFLDGNGLHL